jgi:ABC-type transport system involved in cytochrome bd biosynthesis fused ATPase/permease subunit
MVFVDKLTVQYENKEVISDLSFRLEKGEKLALTGISGSGKTTLLNVLSGFVPEYNGKIIINGKELNIKNIKQIRSELAWLPQNVSLNMKNVRDLFDISFGFFVNHTKQPQKEIILEKFKTLNLEPDLYEKSFNDISVGQKQRVLLTQILLMNKPILLADEPTAALDLGNRESVIDLVFSMKDLTVIAATHDEFWIKRSDKIIDLSVNECVK